MKNDIRLCIIALVIAIFFFYSCVPSKPRYSRSISELIRMSDAMDESNAKATIAKYTGKAWVDSPYLDATISVYLRKDPGFVDHYYQDKIPIKLRDTFIGKGLLATCLQVSIHPMEFVKDPRSDWKKMIAVRCHPKEICTRTIEEEEKVLIAFFSLKARYGSPRY